MASTVFPAASGGVTQKVQEFTATGTFTAPSNVAAVEVFLVSGGGGGGCSVSGGSASTGSGGGGGGGVGLKRFLTVTPGTSYTVTIGGGASALPNPAPIELTFSPTDPIKNGGIN